jgi:putative flavoprotein involved in K+ transport
MADYLEEYARRMHLPVRSGTRVDALEGTPDGYVVTAGDSRFEADQIVVTTGPYQYARVPSWASDLDESIAQIHSNDYKNVAQLPEGDILVVGAGNTGAELALEAARAGHRVLLSGRNVGQVPGFLRRWNGRIFWFLATRVMTTRNAIGRKIRAGMRAGHSSPLVRIRTKEIPEAGIERVARIAGVRGGKPLLADGRTLDVAGVVWCCGFTMNFSWIHLPIFSDDGYPIHEDGLVATAPGLYFVGLPFQRSLSSASLVGVGRDAALVAEWITKAIRATSEAPQPMLAVAH